MAPVNGILFKEHESWISYQRAYSGGIKHGEWKQEGMGRRSGGVRPTGKGRSGRCPIRLQRMK